MPRRTLSTSETGGVDMRRFARLVAEGVAHSDAIVEAGFTGANPKRAAARLLEDEDALRFVQQEHRRYMTAQVGPVARREHLRMLSDPLTPPAVKARLVAIALEYALPDEKAPEHVEPERSLAELEAERDALVAKIRSRPMKTIDVTPVVAKPADLFE
ncbi:hypothetical protein RUR49_11740 [Pseudoxanthobacter sp. M-2]|uniref:hypothetical protein n=1 Tax=Pseudoxanthobacter sp. M-2 TaxID=3078754 RepID=UPI0038FD1F67